MDSREKKRNRIRRAKRTRMRIRAIGNLSLVVHRTPRHIYAQLVSGDGTRILAAASTLSKTLRGQISGSMDGAAKVGALIAERAQAVGVHRVAFDRAGFKYHGRVKALAEAARASGLEF